MTRRQQISLIAFVALVGILCGARLPDNVKYESMVPRSAYSGFPPTGGGKLDSKIEHGFSVRICNEELQIEIYRDLNFEISSSPIMNSETPDIVARRGHLSVVKSVKCDSVERFSIIARTVVRQIEQNSYGKCKTISFTAESQDKSISETFKFIVPEKFANAIICESSLINKSSQPITVGFYELSRIFIDATDFGSDSSYKFWSFQGGSYPERYDWIFPLTKKYERENYQGMNAPDYGGGIPVVDLWTKTSGLAFAVIDKKPELIGLPVRVTDSGSVSFSITDSNEFMINPHQSADLIRYAIILHHGDFFNGLRTYSDLMQAEGFNFPKARSNAYQPEWCAWGYERDFNKEQILKSLPVVKKLGFGWVTIDDGWQNNLGDWEPNTVKFPGGEKDFEAFIDSITLMD